MLRFLDHVEWLKPKSFREKVLYAVMVVALSGGGVFIKSVVEKSDHRPDGPPIIINNVIQMSQIDTRGDGSGVNVKKP